MTPGGLEADPVIKQLTHAVQTTTELVVLFCRDVADIRHRQVAVVGIGADAWVLLVIRRFLDALAHVLEEPADGYLAFTIRRRPPHALEQIVGKHAMSTTPLLILLSRFVRLCRSEQGEAAFSFAQVL